MKRTPALLSLLVLSILAIFPVEVWAAPLATVQTATRSTFKRRGTPAFAKLNARTSLDGGDIVRTGAQGKASLLFVDGSQVRLNENAAVEITPPGKAGGGRRSFFRALSGQVWARLRPGTAVRTRAAVAGVRGTEILLQVADNDTTTLTVLAGSVDFFNEFGAVIVNASQQSVAVLGRAPTKPIAIDNPGLLIEWTFDLDYAVLPREKFFTTLDANALQASLPTRVNAAQANPTDVAKVQAYGDALFDLRRYQQALAAYQSVPNDALAVREGYALLELGDLDQAQARFQLAQNAPNVEAGGTEAALVGLAQLELTRNRPAQAETFAQQAVDAAPDSAEALIALGVAQLRQSGKLEAASTNFEKAQNAQPAALRYQAQAWQVLALLASGQNDAALKQAQAAVAAEPSSGLARGHLALALLYDNQAFDAAKEARRAVELNPNSVAGRVALAQTLLASGETDAAARAAAKATALDPQLPQAFYVLGLADAARRDYTHSARELQEGLRLAPDFLPAVAALARVYNLMGREKEATALLTDFQARYPQSDQVLAAFGQVYYQQAQYGQAATQYEKTVELQPNSALYQAELARLLLDDNQLNAALKAAQRAVFLAPQVAQYHAILGLAAEFSNLTAYADREFRTAIALDPQNSLALFRLSLRDTDRFITNNTVTQALLYDPAVSRQQFRGGIDGQVRLNAGSRGTLGTGLAYHAQNDKGTLYSFGLASYDRNNGASEAPNDGLQRRVVQEYVNYLPDNRTNVLLQGAEVRSGNGFSGPANVLDDLSQSSAYVGALAARRRIGSRNYLWVGARYTPRYENFQDPNSDSALNTVIQNFFFFNRNSDTSTRVLEPEIRFDLNLNARPERRSTFTVGAAYVRTHLFQTNDVTAISLNPPIPLAPAAIINNRFNSRAQIGYVQMAQRVNDRLSYIAQMRYQQLDSNFSRTVNGVPTFTNTKENNSRPLPALLVNYQLDQKTSLRLFANRRSQGNGDQSLLPTQVLLSSEVLAFPQGNSVRNRLYELDIERYFSPRTFGKIFVSNSSAENLSAANLILDQARRKGVGVRLNHQINNTLFANLALATNRTTNRTANAPFDGLTGPFQPARNADFTLNYVDPKGNKAAASVVYTGSFFNGGINQTSGERLRGSGNTILNLYFAREPSVKNEVFFVVNNVFDTNQRVLDQFPAPGRSFLVGLTHRFR